MLLRFTRATINDGSDDLPFAETSGYDSRPDPRHGAPKARSPRYVRLRPCSSCSMVVTGNCAAASVVS